MKTCAKCGETKPTTEFSKNSSKRDGLTLWCKSCNSAAYAAWAAANTEKKKAANAAWHAANREKAKASNSAWYAANPEKARAYKAKQYAANPEKGRARAAKWAADNPERKKAHDAAYYAANAEKIRAASAAWIAANPERAKAAKAKLYAANPDKVKARTAAWAAANPERVKASTAARYAANPEAFRIHWHNRRARKRENGGKLSKGLSAKLFKLQRGKCACGCKQPLGTGYHMDHIMPLALGGANEDWNIQLLRQRCNNQKHAKHPIDFMQQRGFLL